MSIQNLRTSKMYVIALIIVQNLMHEKCTQPFIDKQNYMNNHMKNYTFGYAACQEPDQHMHSHSLCSLQSSRYEGVKGISALIFWKSALKLKLRG